MSIYRCNRCDEIRDADSVICHVDPTNDTQLICEGCQEAGERQEMYDHQSPVSYEAILQAIEECGDNDSAELEELLTRCNCDPTPQQAELIGIKVAEIIREYLEDQAISNLD